MFRKILHGAALRNQLPQVRCVAQLTEVWTGIEIFNHRRIAMSTNRNVLKSPARGSRFGKMTRQMRVIGKKDVTMKKKITTKTLTQRPAWKALAAQSKKLQRLHLRELFAKDPKRGERMTVEAAGLFLDYSKNRITDRR
jgi:hypothetical protein